MHVFHAKRRAAGRDLMGPAVMIGGGLKGYRCGWEMREVLIQGVGRGGRGDDRSWKESIIGWASRALGALLA